MSESAITLFEDRKMQIALTKSQLDDIVSIRNSNSGIRINIDYDGTIQIFNYVGFISRGNTRLQILPKIYEKFLPDAIDEERAAMKALIEMLRATAFNNILMLPEQTSSASETDLFELFIGLFAAKVIEIYSRSMNREYIAIEDNCQFIRGKINFPQNIKHNAFQKHYHYISYQSFEHDNLINNVIKTVVLRLLTVTCSSENKKELRRALMLLDDAKEIYLTKNIIESVKFSRLNYMFETVYSMAKMFYFNLSPESYCGHDTNFSFLIPLNALYEEYLYKVFDGIMPEYTAKHHCKGLFASNEGQFSCKVNPDIILHKDGKSAYVIDAKYKNPNYEDNFYKNISQGDLYQIFSYARIFETNKVALIYPSFDEQITPFETIKLKDSAGDIELVIGCIDIKNTSIEENRKYIREEFIAKGWFC